VAPNVLVIMTDQERYAPPYEGPELAELRRTHLPAHERLRAQGVELHGHHTSSTACLPSRASLFTGHYPSLHGVTSTDGLAKEAHDPGVHWLDPDSVPTMGAWFRAAGYRTYYRGKWHISHADLLDPETGLGLKTNDRRGSVDLVARDLYERTDRLAAFGFGGWVGPEPHGPDPANCGTVRDPLYRDQVLELFDRLEADADDVPWLAVAAFVNPHDIVFSGFGWEALEMPPTPDWVPDIPAAPSQDDSFAGRPRAQAEFRDAWPALLYPQPTDAAYRRMYYWLHTVVDREIDALLERLSRSRFADDTIVVFTSDHGEMLGAHGGMQQKFHTAFAEAIRVPLVVAGPGIRTDGPALDLPTTHVDLLPTLLGLAEVDADVVAKELASTHIEVHPLVGRDLSPLLTGSAHPDELETPVYFMTDDRVTHGLRERNVFTHEPVTPVGEPSRIEAVVGRVDGRRYKLTHYHDELTDWRRDRGLATRPDVADSEWELYALDDDPEERTNLAAEPSARATFDSARSLLEDARDAVRLAPDHRNAR
jgi:arylsulfatase A-like enzyme